MTLLGDDETWSIAVEVCNGDIARIGESGNLRPWKHSRGIVKETMCRRVILENLKGRIRRPVSDIPKQQQVQV